MAVFCSACGKEVLETTIICPNCGSAVAVTLVRSNLVACLLCFFLGYLGLHRFYVGKVGTGILWLCTGGLLGVGWVIDFIMIVLGVFKDKNGQTLSW